MLWFVTGAGRGLGRAFTEAALRRGDRVVATVRRDGALAGLAAAHPGRLFVRRLDVADRAAVVAVVDETAAAVGVPDVVVNNAGYGLVGAVEELSEAELRAQFDVNLFGAVWVTQAVLPHLRRRGSGRIVQVSTVGAVGHLPLFGAYNATKWALEAMSAALAEEVAPLGIRVHLLQLGGFATDWAGSSMRFATPDPAYTATREAILGQPDYPPAPAPAGAPTPAAPAGAPTPAAPAPALPTSAPAAPAPAAPALPTSAPAAPAPAAPAPAAPAPAAPAPAAPAPAAPAPAAPAPAAPAPAAPAPAAPAPAAPAPALPTSAPAAAPAPAVPTSVPAAPAADAALAASAAEGLADEAWAVGGADAPVAGGEAGGGAAGDEEWVDAPPEVAAEALLALLDEPDPPLRKIIGVGAHDMVRMALEARRDDYLRDPAFVWPGDPAGS
ncbi:SDR family NAD(P)-dependent oxidoreductase [Amorphoplanes digitatis]|uniref:NAD(P)-dependent dehydrogenase (Short-subunit alcohol dehydrogenase family) n=1 Tax=Actinoplanes digitatis TaxID=1868 RepID=A0A7W7HUA9_9ACTN|nr:SDR family NAD(P)-dependent oxidoreductase [Actinoplanes digitatis]MBB4760921.1 NAD(P)-dependent dehydrogenase (short-subunit alcohol dehydrogenase family) [Actinoplanes digitatis]